MKSRGLICTCDCDICCSCTLGICKADCTTFQGLIDMWVSLLCPTEDGTFHNFTCLKGECEDCGIDMFMTYLGEENRNSEKLMSWKCYQKIVHRKTRVGLDKTLLRL